MLLCNGAAQLTDFAAAAAACTCPLILFVYAIATQSHWQRRNQSPAAFSTVVEC
jgi:hypothetical protein